MHTKACFTLIGRSGRHIWIARVLDDRAAADYLKESFETILRLATPESKLEILRTHDYKAEIDGDIRYTIETAMLELWK